MAVHAEALNHVDLIGGIGRTRSQKDHIKGLYPPGTDVHTSALGSCVGASNLCRHLTKYV